MWKLKRLSKLSRLSLRNQSIYTIWKDYLLASTILKEINLCLLFINSLLLNLQLSNKGIEIWLKKLPQTSWIRISSDKLSKISRFLNISSTIKELILPIPTSFTWWLWLENSLMICMCQSNLCLKCLTLLLFLKKGPSWEKLLLFFKITIKDYPILKKSALAMHWSVNTWVLYKTYLKQEWQRDTLH